MENITHAYENAEINFKNKLTANQLYNSSQQQDELQENLKNLVDTHCDRYNVDKDNIYIEYCYNNSLRRGVPSKISENCILKLIIFLKNDASNCLIVTCIDHEKYIYKRFNLESNLYICRQQIGKHIVTNPSNYIYANTCDYIETLDVYVYSTKQDIIPVIKDNFKPKISAFNINANNSINYEYYNDILYYKKYKHKFIEDIILNNEDNNKFIYKLTKSDISNQTTEIIKELNSITKSNRFSNKLVYNNALSEITCEWIVELYKSHSRGVSKYILTKTESPQLHNLTIFIIFKFILPFVTKSLAIDDLEDLIIDVDDIIAILCVKDGDLLKMNKPNKRKQFTIDIILSSTNISNSKYLSFNDGTIFDIKQGDAIIYHSDSKKYNYTFDVPIYILEVTFDIKLNKLSSNIY
jgi:hypothetical protein